MKKKHRLIVWTCVAVPALMAAQPQVAGSGAEGCLSRGKLLYESRNYAGAIDQLQRVATMPHKAWVGEQADYYRALSEFERGKTSSLKALQDFIDTYPTSPLAVKAQERIGSFYFYRADYANALAAYAGVRAGALNDDSDEDIAYREAYCHLQLEQWQQAEALYNRLSATKRYAQASQFYHAYIAYAQGDYNTAYRKFSEINRAGELGYQAQYYICQIEYTRKRYDRVIELGRSLLSDEANDYFAPELNRLVGESLYQQGDDAQAQTYLKKYMSTTEDPIVRTAAYAMGVIDFRSGNWNGTVDNMNHVTSEQDALAQSAYLYIGQCQLKSGQTTSAAMAFEKAAGMNYDRSVRETAFYNYAISQNKGGRTPFDRSIDMFEQFLNEYPNSKYASQVEGYLIDAYMNASDYDKALASISHIKHPSAKVLKAKQTVLYNLGVQELKNDNTQRAASLLKQAIAVGNYDRSIVNESKLWLAEAQYRSGNYSEAATNQLAYVNSVPKADSNYGLAQYNLGYSLFQQRRYDAAKKAFQNAIDSRTLDKSLLADAYNRIGDTQYYTGDYTAAEQSYSQSAGSSQQGSTDYALYQKAMMAGLNKQYQSKADQLEDLLRKHPESSVAPAAMLERGNALATLGKTKEATSAYAQLTTKYPHTAEARKAMLQTAIVSKNASDTEGAIRAYKQVISKYPTSTEAQAAAEDLKLIYADRGQLRQFGEFLSSVPGAPSLDVSEVDRLTFESAEKDALASKPSIAKMQAYISNNPDGAYTAKAYYYIGRYQAEHGNTAAALQNIDRALQAGSDASFAEDALSIKSEILAKSGRSKEAIEALKQLEAKASSGDSRITAQLGLMRAYSKASNWKETARYAGLLLSTSGLTADEEREATLSRAIANSHMGNGTQAQTDLKRLAADVQTEQGAQAAVELARLQYASKSYKAAEKTLNSLIDAGTPHYYWLGQGFILLSDIYNAQGKTFEACEYLESLKANYPGKDKETLNAIELRLNKWKRNGKAASQKAAASKQSKKGRNQSADNKSTKQR